MTDIPASQLPDVSKVEIDISSVTQLSKPEKEQLLVMRGVSILPNWRLAQLVTEYQDSIHGLEEQIIPENLASIEDIYDQMENLTQKLGLVCYEIKVRKGLI